MKFIAVPSLSPPPPGAGDPLAALEMTRLALWKMYNQSNGGSTNGNDRMPPVSLPSLPTELLAQHAANAAAKQAEKRKLHDVDDDVSKDRVSPVVDDVDGGSSRLMPTPPPPPPPSSQQPAAKRNRHEDDDNAGSDVEVERISSSGGGGRRQQQEEAEELARKAACGLLPGANIKITSRGVYIGLLQYTLKVLYPHSLFSQHPSLVLPFPHALVWTIIVLLFSGDSSSNGVDGSLVVSMEINGTSYQGVLFAQQPGSNSAKNGGDGDSSSIQERRPVS